MARSKNIQSLLPYKLTDGGAVTSVKVRFPNGVVYTHDIPLLHDSIVILTIIYTEGTGLRIFAIGKDGKGLLHLVPKLILDQFSG